MSNNPKTMITVEVSVMKPIETVWKSWTEPTHITQWNFASDDWCCPSSSNDLTIGGKFCGRMEAKDGSFGFDFIGTYTEVIPGKRLAYLMEDGRTAEIDFIPVENGIHVKETFQAETINDVELQRNGWQAILNNFKKHTETLG